MKIHVFLIQSALLFGFWSITMGTSAKDTFQITLTTPTVTESRGYSSAEEAIDDLGDEGLSNFDPGYTSTSEASIVLDFRGLRTLLNYPVNSTRLTFQIPSLGINESFEGATRDGSQEMLEEYLKKNGNGILTRMLQSLAANTPIDPVAGNPASLSGQMIDDSFTAGASAFKPTREKKVFNSVAVGLATGRFKAGKDYEQDVFTLPLSYTINFDNPGYRLRLNLPISYTRVGDSESYSMALGASLRIPFSDTWSITPGIRAGAVGSRDLAAAAIVYTGTLTSNYIIPFDVFRLGIANMVGVIRTDSVSLGSDYEVDYDLSNTVYKNGLSLEIGTQQKLLSLPTSWQASVAHTLITGDDVFVDDYWDLSLSWGARNQANKGISSKLRLGATFTIGNHDYVGGRLNLGYTF